MTPREQVGRVRRGLLGVAIVSALLWGTSVAIVARALGGAVVGAALGAVTLAGLLWWARGAWSSERCALWVEAQVPSLEYALVTGIDPSAKDAIAWLAPVAASADLARLVWRAGARAGGRAIAALAVAISVAGIAPVWHRTVRPVGLGDGSSSAIRRLSAEVTPPAYTHFPSHTIREPVTIAALVGSTIRFSGSGSATSLKVKAGDSALRIVSSASRWTAELPVTGQPTIIRFTDRTGTRLVSVEPVSDQPPVVVLDRPARDSTRRAVSGTLALDARATDDIGLEDGAFELIVSSGDEEGSFRSRTVRVAATTFDGSRSGSLHAVVPLAPLAIAPGNLLSIRAVARDGNDGIGASETRTIRIATVHEYDSLAVTGAPPPTLDSAYLSQRMIVIETEALVRQQRHLSRAALVRASQAIGDKEERITNKVRTLLYGSGGWVYSGSEGDEGNYHANDAGGAIMPEWQHALFDTAAGALTNASNDLAVAEPRPALHPEYIALRALDRARVALRLYLRGAPPTIIVNTERVRLVGTDTAHPIPRASETAQDREASISVKRIEDLGVLAQQEPIAAADSAMVLRSAIASRWPEAGAALGEAAEALRAGRSAGTALARARRAMTGAAHVAPGLALWGAGEGTTP